MIYGKQEQNRFLRMFLQEQRRKLLGILQDGDALIVTMLDRFARSMSQGSILVSELIDKGVRLKIEQVATAIPLALYGGVR